MKTRPNVRSIDDWATKISARWQDNVSAIFEVGNMLEAAREELGPAQFAVLVGEKLKYSKAMVSQLTKIADDPKLRDFNMLNLPPSWGTLYALTKLTEYGRAVGRTA
jgi:hypothetical protein